MIWLTFRQFRAQTIAVVTVVIAFGIALALTGPGLRDLYDSSGLASCHGSCTTLTTHFLAAMKADAAYPAVYFTGFGLLLLAPALIGAFWGAPMVSREVEGRTLRFVWHQSVTPARWATAKIALLGLAGMAFAAVASLMLTWWAAPIDDAGGFPVGGGSQISRFSKAIFDARGIVPVGYAALGFVLGVTVGVLTRRTVPAMAVTLVLVAAIQFIVPTWVRPNMVPPVTVTSQVLSAAALQQVQIGSEGDLTVPIDLPGAWIVTDQTVTPNGRVFSLLDTPQCMDQGLPQTADCIAKQDLRQIVTYQPANRFWEFQGIETAILLATSIALAVINVLWIRRFRL